MHFHEVQWSRLSSVLVCLLFSGCADSSSCGEGFEQQGNDCVPICPACNDHEQCEKTTTSAQCQCVVGYAGDPCEWSGGLQNAGFAIDESWLKTKGAAILPLAMGPSGPGIASFASSVTCNAGAVSQVVEMPSYEDAEPFVIEVTYRMENVLGVDVGYNRAFRTLRSTVLGWNTDRFCLGEAGYGGPVNFQIAAAERLPDCFTAPIGTIEVDNFEILVAESNECPPPGAVLNGDANVGEGGWVFDVESIGTGATEASLVSGVGQSGSDGARIYKPAGGDRLAGMYTQLTVPLADSLPSPALRFWWSATRDRRYYVDLGTYPGTRIAFRPLDVLESDGEPQTSTYCLPPWIHGGVADLTFTQRGGFTEDEAELVVDRVEIISDDRCGNSADLLDPSFDSSPNRWPGVLVSIEEPGSGVRVLNDPARAHPPGAGLLELSYASNASRLEAQTWVWVPPSEENRGPQLVFYSNVPASPGANVFWAFGTAGAIQDLECVDEFCSGVSLTEELPPGLGWRRNAVCLPAEWAERWYRFRVAIRPSDDPFEAFDPPRTVLLDDFEVRSDESCPTL
ncbi:MAG: hypothetical protein JRJ80_02080 [Deltaproteobacteria bacterium]|nr:hypothetical protein [Deltaproteobacteria bacterium]MBW2159227.1 hypothetical protein [Deltaproteobacteria bacterium]MBW2214770.1 hypothetical protein [Deltaproteobacteria bacterium]